MTDSLRLFIPGPTQVEPSILQELARPAIGHRGPEIETLIAEVQQGLQKLLETQHPVLLFTSSATTIMEAALRNTVGERGVLHLVCGAFSEKWWKISRSLGKNAEAESVEWGQGFTPEQVRTALQNGSYDAVCLTHNETSTGVMNPLQEIAAVVREVAPDTLLLVDAVSSMSAVRIPFDEWGIDVLLAGVQKAFALPPGLAVAAVSPRTYERAATLPHRGLVMDFLDIRKYLDKNQTPSTPSTPHLYGLRARLQTIHAETQSAREARHCRMAELTLSWTRRHFAPFAAPGFESPTVTCVQTPDDFPVNSLRTALREQGIALGSGYGRLKGNTFRVGHMGEHTEEGVRELLGHIDAWSASQS